MNRVNAHHEATSDARPGVAEFDVRSMPSDLPPRVRYDASPYLLDLSWQTKQDQRAEAIRAASKRSRRYGWFARMLDERIHLRDIRTRSLSANPTGWKDFPPASARSLTHAVAITVSRFFNEHPLADLTLFSLIHLTGLLMVRLVIHPVSLLFRRKDAAEAPALVERPSFSLQHSDAALSVVETTPSTLSLRGPLGPKRSPAQTEEIASGPSTAPRNDNVGVIQSEPHLSTEQVGDIFRTAFRRTSFWKRPLVGLAMAASVFIIPLGAVGSLATLQENKDAVIASGIEGAKLLKAAIDAGKTMDFASANDDFTAAAGKFDDARERLGAIGNIVTYAASYIPTDHAVSIAQPMLTVGREVALGGALMTRGMEALGTERSPVEKIRILRSHLDAAIPHLTRASLALASVSPAALPDGYGDLTETAKAELPAALDKLRHLVAAAEFTETLLGGDGKMRYLVVFQNDRELRPTGGFVGSFALVDVAHGEIEKLDVPGGGSYDLQGSLREHVISPRPLRLINPHWQFQDANWSPDFPTSARRLTWFYEKSGGPTTDGVIAVNASLLERLIGAIGPIEMPEYGVTIDEDNFYMETQTEVELDYDKEANRPKQFIADLAPKVLERAMAADGATLLAVAEVLRNAGARKDLQIWLRDDMLQARASALGWTGDMRSAPGDYLAIVHTNIAGQKTDKAMREEVDHEAKLLADGSGIVTLTIRRTHTGAKGDLFSGVRNVDYLRVYVPEGSTLVEAGGFSAPDPKLIQLPDADYRPDPELAAQEEGMRTDRASGTDIYEENGKTVFGNWVMTDPGETSVVTLVYRLPAEAVTLSAPSDSVLHDLYDRFAIGGGATLTYSLMVQKQSGANPFVLTSHVAAPRGYYPVWQSQERTDDERGRMSLTETVAGDRSYGTILQTR